MNIGGEIDDCKNLTKPRRELHFSICYISYNMKKYFCKKGFSIYSLKPCA